MNRSSGAAMLAAVCVLLVSAEGRGENKKDAQDSGGRSAGRVNLGGGVGLTAIVGVHASLELGYLASENLLVGVDLRVVNGVETKNATTRPTLFEGGAGVAFFVSSNFFLHPTLRLRSGSFEGSDEKGFESDVRFSDLALGAGLGNRWDWGGGFVSVEWFAIQAPISTLSFSVEKKEPSPQTLATSPPFEISVLHLTLGGG